MANIISISLSEKARKILEELKIDNVSAFINNLIIQHYENQNNIDFLLKEYKQTLNKLLELENKILNLLEEKEQKIQRVKQEISQIKKIDITFDEEDLQLILKTPDHELIHLIPKLRKKYNQRISVTDLLAIKKQKQNDEL